jgi:hypothetical protein
MRWQEIVEEEAAKLIRDGALAASKAAKATITQETGNEVIEEAKRYLCARRFRTALNGFGERAELPLRRGLPTRTRSLCDWVIFVGCS